MEDCSNTDPFLQACERLEKLTQNKEIVGNNEYEAMRAQLLTNMKHAIAISSIQAEKQTAPLKIWETFAFGQLHAMIVKQLSGAFVGSGDEITKDAMLGALAEMAEKGALYTGEYHKIAPIIELVTQPLPPPIDLHTFFRRLVDIHRTC